MVVPEPKVEDCIDPRTEGSQGDMGRCDAGDESPCWVVLPAHCVDGSLLHHRPREAQDSVRPAAVQLWQGQALDVRRLQGFIHEPSLLCLHEQNHPMGRQEGVVVHCCGRRQGADPCRGRRLASRSPRNGSGVPPHSLPFLSLPILPNPLCQRCP